MNKNSKYGVYLLKSMIEMSDHIFLYEFVHMHINHVFITDGVLVSL